MLGVMEQKILEVQQIDLDDQQEHLDRHELQEFLGMLLGEHRRLGVQQVRVLEVSKHGKFQ